MRRLMRPVLPQKLVEQLIGEGAPRIHQHGIEVAASEGWQQPGSARGATPAAQDTPRRSGSVLRSADAGKEGDAADAVAALVP